MEAQASMSNDNQVVVTTTKGPITVDSVKKAEFSKKGFLQAQLRQVITTVSSYPTTRVGNSMNDSLFSTNEFAGIESKVYTNTETRVAWTDVPEGTTAEQVAERLAKVPKATLYKVLSNAPILTREQESAITRGIRDRAFFANKQVVKHPEGAKNAFGIDISGEFVRDKNNNIQYKVVGFSLDGQEDLDYRTTDKTKHYVSPEIQAEIVGAGILGGQDF